MEGVTARLVQPDQIPAVLDAGEIPVLIDPQAHILTQFPVLVVVDARLIKKQAEMPEVDVPLRIGLGPGFRVGENCDAVIETRRSHTLGRVYWHGSAQADSGQPEGDPKRVLRAPETGIFVSHKRIADHCEAGELIGAIASEKNNQETAILAPLSGVLRGLIREGIQVPEGLKIGDIDPRDDPSACFLVSDKSLAIGGGVLEAILSKPEIREKL